ncbi:hypothetical protein JAAARDRAFT_138934 [Jaapia argillacea MUCL 33604]|uniref:CHAT domain-containing protein n=1 Tax=Jaapia argillacea MUCL 33604 TaxID=933084 RepID=A0A067PEN8_9AGAM|nr:hypothetical protein JAAARDRAFT_138934 [Jaapia argillacea MUCL 33604]
MSRAGLRIPQSPSNRSSLIEFFASALLSHHSHSGRLTKLNEAILLLLEGFRSDHIIHLHRFSALLMLSSALYTRYSMSVKNESQDLDDAISLLREALRMTSSHTEQLMAASNNLAGLLSERFHYSDDISFLDEAIQVQRDVISWLPPDHPNQSTALSVLATATHERYHHALHAHHRPKCIALQQQAVALLPPKDGRQVVYQNNLSRYLYARFLHYVQFLNSHNWESLSDAIVACRMSLQGIDPSNPNFAGISNFLAQLLGHRYFHTKGSDDLHGTIDAFRAAVQCESAPVSQRFYASQLWAKFADDNDHESALGAYVDAIRFLPRLAMLGLNIQSRQNVMTAGTDGLARHAAACAIRKDKYALAIELLEEGRAVFWSQALHLRAPFDELRLKAPDIALDLEIISKELERRSLHGFAHGHADALEIERQSEDLRRLNDSWLKGLNLARSIGGFEDFLLPKSFTSLRVAAANGPVVVLNASRSRCDALILKSAAGDILHVPLPLFTPETERNTMKMRNLAVGSSVPQSRGDRRFRPGRSRSVDPEAQLRSLLATLWTTVVEPVIRALGMAKSSTPSRLWWCATGPFSYLPLHAAGLYGVDGTVGECVWDYVVSSYIPTLTSLVSQPSQNIDSFKVIAVIQPFRPGYEPLPYTGDELHSIEVHVTESCLVPYGLADSPAIVADILSALPNANIVHFACHGVQNSENPLESALILEDGPLKITQLMELSLKSESLAFLSACQTASGDETLPDEAIHLSATLLFTGFRGVVGTMWYVHGLGLVQNKITSRLLQVYS